MLLSRTNLETYVKKNVFLPDVKVCLFSGLVCVVSGVWLAGCEPAKGTKGLSITPSSVTLGASSNTVTFVADNVASNGLALPLSWSVADGELGSITHSSGLSATYRRTSRDGENTVIARDQYENEGYATVRQTSVLGTTERLTLSSANTRLTTSTNTTTITVSGGTGPYSWWVDNESIGTVSHAGGASAVYTGKSNGSNAIHVEDANGAAGSIGVTQTDDPVSADGGQDGHDPAG